MKHNNSCAPPWARGGAWAPAPSSAPATSCAPGRAWLPSGAAARLWLITILLIIGNWTLFWDGGFLEALASAVNTRSPSRSLALLSLSCSPPLPRRVCVERLQAAAGRPRRRGRGARRGDRGAGAGRAAPPRRRAATCSARGVGSGVVATDELRRLRVVGEGGPGALALGRPARRGAAGKRARAADERRRTSQAAATLAVILGGRSRRR
jgi:hypothetical protein